MDGEAFPNFVKELVETIQLLGIPLLGIALLLFLTGVVRFVWRNQDPHGKAKDKELIMWGLIALFVIMSIGGIIQVMKDAFLP